MGFDFLAAVDGRLAALSPLHSFLKFGTLGFGQLSVVAIEAHDQAFREVRTLWQRQGESALQDAGNVEGGGFHARSLSVGDRGFNWGCRGLACWVRSHVNVLQELDTDFGLDPGGFEFGVADQLPGDAHVGSLFKHVRGAGMTQQVTAAAAP